MCQSKQLKRHKGNIFSALSVGILAFLFTALVPAQAFAVTGGTCNSDLEWYLEGPGAFPDTQWFVNDVMKVKATFKAGAITGGTGPEYLQIPDFGFAADCEAVPGGLTWGNCILKNPASVDITFLGKPVNDPVQTCKNPAGTAINFLAPESNRITFTPTNGPIQLPEGSSCKMSWNFQVTDLNGATSVKLNQVAAFAAGSKSAECVYYSGGQKFIGTTSSGRNAVVTVNSCEIEVKKQICDVDGSDCTVEGNWYDADTVGTALDLSPSGRAAYRAIITNTGSVAYTGDITINDGPLDTSWTAKSLAPGASVTVGGAGTVANWSDYCKTHASVSNTIEVDAMCRTGDSPVSAHATNEAWGICNYIPPATGITIEKATNGQDADIATGPLIPVGAAVTWSYVVRNTSNVTLTDISASDDKEGAISCPKTTLVAGEEMTCTSKIGTATAGQYANLASVSGKYGSDTVNDTDPSHYFGTTTSITIEKATNGQDADAAPGPNVPVGDAVTWSYVVRNTSNVTLTDISASDDKEGAITCPKTTLVAGEEMTCTSKIGTATAGQYANLASVSGKYGSDTVNDTDPSHYFGTTTSITIEKATNGQDADAAPGPNVPVGDAVTWSYVVRNTSNVTLTDISASDDKEGPISCPKTTLVAGEEMTCTSKIGTATAGQYANLASVSGKYGSDTVNDTDPSHYFGTGDANILLVKEISVDDGATWKDANNVGSAAIAVYPSDALYRFTVTNNGNAPLKDVIVNDSELGIIDYPIGDMAVDEVVVITSTEEPLLAVEDRCDSRGTFVNTAVASGASAETGTPVSDSDPAVLKCIGEPHITIVKEISPTGGEPWYDDETPPQEFPSDAWYRITVTNDGTAPLENVEVLDGDLSVDEVIGNLAVDETVVLTSAQVTALYQKDRCNGSGRVGNTASVSGNSVDDPDDTVDDSDTATLVCVGLPALDVIKEISVNNVDWFDANTEEDAVLAQAPSNAWYRITVKNTGLVDMTNVVLNDGTLGIVDYPVGTIAAGQEVMLTSGDIPKLYYPGRCTGKGTFGNTATAKGTSSETGSESSDSDEAWLECTGTPDIQIVKEISVNNGVTWYDGSTPSVLAPSDAWYRIKVTNTGTTDLDNVKVNDLVLGIVDYSIGYLAIGDSVTLTNGEIAALFKQDRCTTSGTYVNTATAAGVSLEYPYGSVNDSDAATLVCGGKVDICADGGRPSTLKLQYNGTYESDNEQGRVGVPNLTGPLPSSPVTVKLYDKNELEATINNVNVGDPLTVYGSWTQSGKIPTTVGVEVFYGSKLLQSIAFHGSCSAPLNVGDKFGAVTIIGYTH